MSQLKQPVDCGDCNASGRIYDAYTKTHEQCPKCKGRGSVEGRWFKWVAEIEVHETWVADGFELTQDRLKSMLESELGFSTSNETRCRITRSPGAAVIRDAQGYPAASK